MAGNARKSLNTTMITLLRSMRGLSWRCGGLSGNRPNSVINFDSDTGEKTISARRVSHGRYGHYWDAVSIGTLSRHAGAIRYGRVTHTKPPPGNPVRFTGPEPVVGERFYVCGHLGRLRLCRLRHRCLCPPHRGLAGEPDGPCQLCPHALEQALHERRPVRSNGLIHQSDRGSQYVSIKYSERLAEAGIEPSVGSVGDSYDNAWPRRSMASTRPRSSIGAGRGAHSRRSSSPRWTGSTGSTPGGSVEPIGNIPRDCRIFCARGGFRHCVTNLSPNRTANWARLVLPYPSAQRNPPVRAALISVQTLLQNDHGCWCYLRGGRDARKVRKRPARRPPSGGLFKLAHRLLFVLGQMRHVEIARGLQPVLVGLDREPGPLGA